MTPTSADPLLFVSQLAPPSSLVAARRVAGLTKYLARLGYRITVLTSAISGEGPIEGAERVVRTPDLMASRLNWRRAHFAALTGREQEQYGRPSRLEQVVVPDLAALTWLPPALPRALALARRARYAGVITTSPPSSAHAIGYALRQRGIPWIAELRDGWTFEPPRQPWPLAAQRQADRALEVKLLKRANAVVAVTEPIVTDLRERLGLDAQLITNGFDPEERGLPLAEQLLSPDRHSFVHTGRMALAGVNPRPLLEAVRILQRRKPAIAGRIELVFVGPLSTEEHELLSASDLRGVVRTIGPLEHRRTLRLQEQADTLLVVTGGAKRRSVATGKLFEYLAAERPILVLGEETAAARIVAETRTGSATSATDPAAIARALVHAAAGEPHDRDGEALERYSWPVLAAGYAELIESVRR
jgi:glycosyltransferase involved in cell wall biosynthesis